MPKNRIEIVDALRGFSLAGIVIVHMVENYTGSVTPDNVMEATHQGIMDNIVDGFIFLFLRGKFFALFSFLFGLSFFIQMDNAKIKGTNLSGRFLWRLLILLVIGCLHHMFYRGDILTIYAVLGIFLIPFYKINNKWILGFATLLFLGLARYMVFLWSNGATLFIPGEMMPDSPETIHYFNIIKNGSLTDVFLSNSTEGHLTKLEFQLGVFGRGYITFGFFLLGLYIGRIGFFKKLEEHKKWMRNILLGSIVLFVASMGLVFLAFSQLKGEITFDNWTAMLGLTALDLNNIAMTSIIIVLFIMWYKNGHGKRWLKKFSPYGKMALTNYLIQSVIGTFFLYGWGLGYLGELRNSYTFLFALLVIAIQMAFSVWWLRKFQYGPLEWLWRSLTYLKWYPLKKRTP